MHSTYARKLSGMADLDFQTFYDWELAIRRHYAEAPKFTEKDAHLEWSRISRKREYADIIEALEDSMAAITTFENRLDNFAQNAKHARLTPREGHKKREGLIQATLQCYATLRDHLRHYTLLLIQTNKDDKVVSREWSQRYAGDIMESTSPAAEEYGNAIDQCRMTRKRLGSLGAPVDPLPDPFGEDDDEMEEAYEGDMDMEEGAASEDGWKLVRELGEGSFGQVLLWVRHDEAGKVVEKCASKDVSVRDTPLYSDGADENIREAFMHTRVSAKDPDGRHIVVYRGEDLFYDDRVHRLYLEFCPHGDLWAVMDRMFKRKDKTRREIAIPVLCATVAREGDTSLRAVFESLARAVYLMTFGAFPGADPAKGWDRMIHRDIKPENTFLSEPYPDRWPGIPSVKMGDFGLAALGSEPALQTTYAGTAQYMPPEITHVRFLKLPKDVLISTPADVWSVGATMADLMNLGTKKEESAEFYNWDKHKSQLPKIEAAGRRFYPTVLVDLVEMCLRPMPDERIEVAFLCECIDAEVCKLSSATLSDEDRLRFPIQDEEYGKLVRLEL